FSDDSGLEEIDRETVRERKQMAYEGIVTLIVTMNATTGELEAPPEIVARGMRGVDDTNGFLDSAQQILTNAMGNASKAQLQDMSLLKEFLRLELKRFIQKQTGARPVITPVVVQV